jgi:hypothetical protein
MSMEETTTEETTEERVNEQVPVATGPSFDQVPMHIDSESDDGNDQKRREVEDLDDDL